MALRTARLLTVLVILCAMATGLEWVPLSPRPRTLATIVLDAPAHRAMLFGGGTYNEYLNDVWTISWTPIGYRWDQLITSGAPPVGRAGHSAVIDPIHNWMVIFGGRSVAGDALTDVYALDLGTATWQQLTPAGNHPSGSVFISAVYCPARHSMIVFDGSDMSRGYDQVNELLLDSMKWKKISPSGTPPEARWSYSIFLDPADNRLIVFGGQTQSGQFVSDVWALKLTPGEEEWTQLNPGGSVPGGRSNCATCYDQAGREAYFFGGFNYNQGAYYNDLYMLDMLTLSWTNVSPGGTLPSERRCAVGVFDQWNRNFLVYGGEDYYGYPGDWYSMNVGLLGVSDWHRTEPNQTTPWLRVTPVNSRQVSIRFFAPSSGMANVRVLDQSGRIVRNLLSGTTQAGNRELVWDGKDERGRAVAAGGYFCYLETDQTGLSTKFVLAR